MAGVERALGIKDRFSNVLNKYIKMLDQAVNREEHMKTSQEELAKAQENLANVYDRTTAGIAERTDRLAALTEKVNTVDAARIENMKNFTVYADASLNKEKEWQQITENMSGKTLKAADSLETMLASLKQFERAGATMRDLDVVVNRINKALLDAGYVWTESAEGLNQQALLTNNSLEKLEKAGLLAKTSTEEFTQAQIDLGHYMGETDGEVARAEAEVEALSRTVAEFQNPSSIAQKAANRLADMYQYLKEKVEQLRDAHAKSDQSIEKHGKGLDGLSKRLLRMAAYYFSTRKLLSYFRQAASRVPDEIGQHFDKLHENIQNVFGGPVAAAMEKMSVGVERINQALASPAGQKFQRAMEAIGSVVGSIVSVAFERFAQLIEWMGNHAPAVAMAAGVAFAFLAAKLLMTAGAALLAHAPLMLIAAGAVAIAALLIKLGVTADKVFGAIASAAYVLYGIGYNIVADMYNVIASFVEFFANVWHDPLGAVAKLFWDLFDVIMGIVEGAAKAIDKLLGTNLAGGLTEIRNSIQQWADDTAGDRVVIERMDKLDYEGLAQSGWAAGSKFGESLSDFALENAKAQELKAISRNTSAIKDAVTDEDLTALVDMAERAFVNNINLTSQTPIITVNGANTGNTEADRQALARAIRDVLIEEVASGPVSPSPAFYGIGG